MLERLNYNHKLNETYFFNPIDKEVTI